MPVITALPKLFHLFRICHHHDGTVQIVYHTSFKVVIAAQPKLVITLLRLCQVFHNCTAQLFITLLSSLSLCHKCTALTYDWSHLPGRNVGWGSGTRPGPMHWWCSLRILSSLVNNLKHSHSLTTWLLCPLQQLNWVEGRACWAIKQSFHAYLGENHSAYDGSVYVWCLSYDSCDSLDCQQMTCHNIHNNTSSPCFLSAQEQLKASTCRIHNRTTHPNNKITFDQNIVPNLFSLKTVCSAKIYKQEE